MINQLSEFKFKIFCYFNFFLSNHLSYHLFSLSYLFFLSFEYSSSNNNFSLSSFSSSSHHYPLNSFKLELLNFVVFFSHSFSPFILFSFFLVLFSIYKCTIKCKCRMWMILCNLIYDVGKWIISSDFTMHDICAWWYSQGLE